MFDIYLTKSARWGFDAYSVAETKGRTLVLHVGKRELLVTLPV